MRKSPVAVRLLSCLMLTLGLLSIRSHASAQEPGSSTCQPDRLRCEYLVNPLAVGVSQPRLDWILVGPSATPRNMSQTAYQILVASTPDLLKHDQGDLWDTGKVMSRETTQIGYQGKALSSRESCYWKVRIWDSLGKVSAWSPAASWEMGLLSPADWTAKWIEATPPAGFKGEYEPIPLLRTEFTLSAKPVTKARLYVTALGLYVMHLNGQRVGDHIFAPDWTDYSKRIRYQGYDVTAMVKAGRNALGGFLGDGWYSGHIGNGGFQAWGKVPALLAQLEVTHADGSVERFVTDANWKTHASPVVSSDFMRGEDYDARLEIPNWDEPGLDTSGWSAATERNEQDRPIEWQVDQPVRALGELRPKSMTQPKPGQYTFDMGQNMVGFVRLRVSAPAGTKITLRHAEMLNTDGTIYTRNLRGAISVDTYICKGGGGVETWQPRFTFHGFRYVELTGLPQAPAGEAVTGVVVGTAIPRTGEFSCSDPAINQLQSNIQWGMRGNYLSVPTDCPQRDERMGWMGDAEVFIPTAAYNGDVAAFFTKWLVDVDDAQHPDGAFTGVSPSPVGKGGGSPGVPAWGDAGVICPYTIYLMYGDTRILRQHLPAMKKWVDWCQVHSADLIRDKDNGANYGDWLSQGENTPKDLLGTAYFAHSTDLLARSYRAVGDMDSAAKYQQLFEQIKAAFNKRYVTADGHIQTPAPLRKGATPAPGGPRMQPGTQSSYCMALQFNLLPEALRSKAGQYLEENVIAHQNHLTTGFIGVGLLLPALCAEGKLKTAYNVFLQDTFPSWLFSVKHGATTIWERWDGWTPEKGFQNPSMNSFNHYSLGSCGVWMFDSVAGIGVDPEQPGFKHIIIRPRPSGTLTKAKGVFDSIHGRIASEWESGLILSGGTRNLQNGIFSLHVVIPINTTATIVLPTNEAASVIEGGKPVAAHPEIKVMPAGQDGVAYEVGSGDYSFSCKTP